MIDFNNIEIGEDLTAITQASKQATHDEIIARHTTALAKELHQQGGKLIQRPQAARVAVNPVSQMEYNSRKHALLNIIRNAELSIVRYPLAESWRQISNEPYNDKATNWKISKHDAQDIIDEMKKLGVYKRFRMDGVASIITVVKDYYKTKVMEEQAMTIKDQEDKLHKYEVMFDKSSEDIWYKGHQIKRLTRKYAVSIGGVDMSVPLNGIDKLFAIFKHIDIIDSM